MPAADATSPGLSEGDLDSLIRSWGRSLKARNMSEKTIRAYSESAMQLATHVRANSDARDAGELRRGHVEDFLADIASKRRPATVSVRVRSLQQFFGWLLHEEEIDRSPMERMKPPIVPDEPVEVLPLDLVKRLLSSCDGRGFADRRDTAIVRLLLDTGMRLNELRALTVDDLDLDLDVAIVLGKGRRPARARSAPRRPQPSTATCACAPAIPEPACRPCGWPRPTWAPSPTTASRRCSAAAAARSH